MTTPTRRMVRAYAREHETERPVRGYAIVLGTYALAVSALGLVGRRIGVRLPDRVSWSDTLLMGAATHKASRLLSKDSVTAPLRVPFARFEEDTGMGEVNESARGHGTRRATGQLLTCPFCLGVWVSTGLTAGMVFAPRFTRLVAATLTAIGVSDALQIGYDAARESLKRSS